MFIARKGRHGRPSQTSRSRTCPTGDWRPSRVKSVFPNTAAYFVGQRHRKASQKKKARIMKKRHFDWEYVFEYIWQHCDKDGIWNGDAPTLAAEFDVPEDEARDLLSELSDRRLIEQLYLGKYAIVKWRERGERC